MNNGLPTAPVSSAPEAGAKKILYAQKKNTNKTMTISVAGFNPGLYLIRITDLVTGKIISKEFLKK